MPVPGAAGTAGGSNISVALARMRREKPIDDFSAD